jgi:hypothetical protein
MKKLSISAREYWARTLKLFQGGEMTSSSGKGGVAADLQVLIDSRLESALHCPSTPPVAVIVMGPIAAGKTTHRKTRLGSGYVHIDSADIFHELSRGDATLDFPDAFASEIEHIGRALTKTKSSRSSTRSKRLGIKSRSRRSRQIATAVKHNMQIAATTCRRTGPLPFM